MNFFPRQGNFKVSQMRSRAQPGTAHAPLLQMRLKKHLRLRRRRGFMGDKNQPTTDLYAFRQVASNRSKRKNLRKLQTKQVGKTGAKGRDK